MDAESLFRQFVELTVCRTHCSEQKVQKPELRLAAVRVDRRITLKKARYCRVQMQGDCKYVSENEEALPLARDNEAAKLN